MAKPKVETAEHRKAFDLYLSMGATRSTARVAQELGKSKASIDGWSSAFGWVQRVIEAEKRIADRSSQIVESKLAEFDAKLLITAKNVLILFAKRLEGAVDADGNLIPKGYKPSALDAKVWGELARDIMKTAESEKFGGLGDLEGVQVEQIERVLIERVKRISRVRKGGDLSSGL